MIALKVKHLIESYDEYVKLLIAELKEVIPLAACHGWRSTRSKAIIACREKVERLKKGVVTHDNRK